MVGSDKPDKPDKPLPAATVSERRFHLDPEYLAVALIDEVERAEGSPAVERVRHEVERPICFSPWRCLEGLAGGCESAPFAARVIR
jgi:hypothetical protein